MSSIWSNVPITCLAWVGHNYLMAGQGQALLLLDKYGKVWDRHEVFRGSSVHQIHGDSREGSRWLVAGSKSCALVTVRDNKLCMEVEEQILSDWIMHCLVLDTVYILTAHNRLVVADRVLGKRKAFAEAKTGPCILYSGILVESSVDLPLVMAGTVTGEVLVWRSDTGEELHRLGL